MEGRQAVRTVQAQRFGLALRDIMGQIGRHADITESVLTMANEFIQGSAVHEADNASGRRA